MALFDQFTGFTTQQGNSPFYWVMIILLCCCLSACQNKAIYKHYIDTPNQVWAKHNPIVFKVAVTEPIAKVKVNLQLRHSGYFTHKMLHGQCIMRSPSGKEDGVDLRIPIKKGADYLGSGFGDLFETTTVIYKKMLLNELGVYEFIISQESKKYLPQVLSVGLIIEEIEL